MVPQALEQLHELQRDMGQTHKGPWNPKEWRQALLSDQHNQSFVRET